MDSMKSIAKVPQPCHASWYKMQETENGRHCKSCTTVVIDFTKMNDQELRTWFKEHRDESFCGHFKLSQVERNHIVIKRKELINNHWSPMQIARIAIFIVFFSSLFSCKPADENDTRHIELSIESDTELTVNHATETTNVLSTNNNIDIGCRKNLKSTHVLGEVMIEDLNVQEEEWEVVSGIPEIDSDDADLKTHDEIQGKIAIE
jgi:hypothetical protein